MALFHVPGTPDMHAPRILVGGLFLEAHSFTPRHTALADFVVTRGPALIERLETSDTALAGGSRRLRAGGAHILPGLSAVAPPGGLAVHEDYLALRTQLLDAVAATRPDAIFLDLHGAMATTEIEDAEGDLVQALRRLVGPRVPIAVALDMHASMTRAMLDATPLWVGYKKNPHVDCSETGERAAQLLLDTLSGALKPVACAIWLPALLLGQLATERGPLAELHAMRRALERSEHLADMSFYNTYAFLDAAEAGQCITAVACDDRAPAAQAAVEALARAVWARRDRFGVDRPALEPVIAGLVPQAGRPVILGDHGDRVLGGGIGDGTHIIATARACRPDLRILAPVTDPDAVHAARKAGVGADLDLMLGGALTPGEMPVAGRWRVKALGEGRFVQAGPFLAGEPADMGPTAVLQCGRLTVLATSRPGLSQDPQAFLSHGEDPAAYDVVVCKSGFHFEPAFRSFGPCVSVDTPGMTNYVPGYFPFRKRPRYWPEDPAAVPDFAARLFPSRIASAETRSLS